MIVAFFHADVKDKICQTQELLKQDQIDTRNSIPEKVFDYFQTVTYVFNNDDFVANIPAKPFLYDGFMAAKSIKLGDFCFNKR